MRQLQPATALVGDGRRELYTIEKYHQHAFHVEDRVLCNEMLAEVIVAAAIVDSTDRAPSTVA
jgi:hypothetical protein